jgi:hypothetical protein
MFLVVHYDRQARSQLLSVEGLGDELALSPRNQEE